MSENVEIKRFCEDFLPIRRMLRQLGAKHAVTKQQTDTFLRLPQSGERRFQRLKVREEQRKVHLVGYTDSYRGGLRDVDYLLTPISRPIKDVLVGALGVRTVVRKKRELWMLGTTRFHLDTVEGVGRVFEVEVVLQDGETSDDAERYLRLFEPYLGQRIEGSNEDLLAN